MIRVGVYCGSITDACLEAHALLNASNPHVGLGSGVSGAIAAACGPTFQGEVRRAWQDEFDEPLTEHDCLVTSAGAGPYRWILHVASVDYKHPDPETGRPSNPSRVRSCLNAALFEVVGLLQEMADEFVLAVPLLGAGHGGLGEVSSADAMMGVLSKFATARPDARLRVVFAVPRHGALIEHAALKHRLPWYGKY